MKRGIVGGTLILCLSATLLGCTDSGRSADRQLSSMDTAPTSTYTPFDRESGERSVVACLRRAGIDAAFDDGGGVSLSGATSADQARKALEDCEEKAGFPTLKDITSDQLAYLYRKTIDERNCLIRHGQRLSPVPDWLQFKREYLHNPYLPYEQLKDLPPDRLMQLEKVCPQPDL